MSQSRHNLSSSKQQNPSDLITDSASGGSRIYGYDSRNEEQCYSKSSHMLGSRDAPSSPTDKCVYESVDSGLVSDQLQSEQLFSSSDDLSLPSTKNNLNSGELTSSIRNKNYTDSGFIEENSMRLDSGFDLNEQFSELDIKKSHLNDLNASSCPTITSAPVKEPSVSCKNIKEETTKQAEFDPLVEYFGQDEDGDTQLHIAIIQGFIEVVYGLIRMAPHPCFLDIPNDYRQTPLHLAVLTSQAPIVRALLVAGVSPDSKDRHGNTALHMASERGAIDCVRALLLPVSVAESSGAGLRYSTAGTAPAPSALDERNYDGQLCTHLAAAGGHVDVLRHLVWFGADVNGRESKCGRTTLHVAAERGRRFVLEFLLTECEGRVDFHLTTFAGHSVYQLAYYADPKMADKLAKLGADQNLPQSDSETDSDDDEMFNRLPIDGFFRGLNGVTSQPISA